MHAHTLTTERLRLRPCAPSDGDRLYGLWNEVLVRHYFWDDAYIPRQRVEQAIAASTASFARAGFGQWLVTTQRPRRFVGSVGLLTVEHPFFDHDILAATPHAIELIFSMLPAYRGCGYATEAVRAVLTYGCGSLGIPRIVAFADARNTASLRVLAKAGMQHEYTEMWYGQDAVFFAFTVHEGAAVPHTPE
jgi:RimJ/RimL family protein N-acetyltransferase